MVLSEITKAFCCKQRLRGEEVQKHKGKKFNETLGVQAPHSAALLRTKRKQRPWRNSCQRPQETET